MTPHAAPTAPNTVDGNSPVIAPAAHPHSPPAIKIAEKISVFLTASFTYSPFDCISCSTDSTNRKKELLGRAPIPRPNISPRSAVRCYP